MQSCQGVNTPEQRNVESASDLMRPVSKGPHRAACEASMPLAGKHYCKDDPLERK